MREIIPHVDRLVLQGRRGIVSFKGASGSSTRNRTRSLGTFGHNHVVAPNIAPIIVRCVRGEPTKLIVVGARGACFTYNGE